MNFEPIYIFGAIILILLFYRKNLSYLLEDKKETLQMLVIFALVAGLVYLICDYILDVIPNNIRG